MKKQNSTTRKTDIRVYCNVCGRELEHHGEILLEDYIEVTKQWGYFSEHDLEMHKFNICEHCYNELEKNFKIPVAVGKVKEVL